jgi:elongation factor G
MRHKEYTGDLAKTFPFQVSGMLELLLISTLAKPRLPKRCCFARVISTKLEVPPNALFVVFANDVGVDDGSTVTDYLPEERARGITITAAAITFPWANRSINLIDTPGHADFTFEVSRSLRILDGVVAVLDGVAGVEAQTETVWRQADEWNLSRIVFVNKMDREGAGFGRTIREIASRLSVRPVVLQLPVFEGGQEGGRFKGVLDIVDLTVFTWSETNGEQRVLATPIRQYPSTAMLEEAKVARTAMVEALAELDDKFLELYVQHEDNFEIPTSSIRNAVRSLTITRAIVPVLCGASLRDIGVEPLLDAIVSYLPSPEDREVPIIRLDGEDQTTKLQKDKKAVCALAFKVIHDSSRGSMVFVRVYQGSITKGMNLINTRTKEKERANRLLRMYADDSAELDSITEGNIGVILGLKSTVTGDTIVNKRSTSLFHLQPIATPPPVFIASIEPDSLSEANSVTDAIQRLLREDPSLSVSTDEDSGQTLLAGMGELHLEISCDKLLRQFGAKCEMGKVRVSYRETMERGSTAVIEKVYERDVFGKLTRVGLTVEVSVLDNSKGPQPSQRHRRQFNEFGNVIDIDLSRAHGLDGVIEVEVFEAIGSGVRAVLQTGPTYHLPLHSILVKVSNFLAFENQTTYQSIVSASRLATKEALNTATMTTASGLMEPFMNVVVTVSDRDVGHVVSDLTSARGGMILSLESNSGSGDRITNSSVYAPPDSTYSEGGAPLAAESLTTVVAHVPLKEMVGYSKTLRSLTQGRGVFVMSLEGFEKMTGDRALSMRRELTGLDP